LVLDEYNVVVLVRCREGKKREQNQEEAHHQNQEQEFIFFERILPNKIFST
jgi:hypothetical protein